MFGRNDLEREREELATLEAELQLLIKMQAQWEEKIEAQRQAVEEAEANAKAEPKGLFGFLRKRKRKAEQLEQRYDVPRSDPFEYKEPVAASAAGDYRTQYAAPYQPDPEAARRQAAFANLYPAGSNAQNAYPTNANAYADPFPQSGQQPQYDRNRQYGDPFAKAAQPTVNEHGAQYAQPFAASAPHPQTNWAAQVPESAAKSAPEQQPKPDLNTQYSGLSYFMTPYTQNYYCDGCNRTFAKEGFGIVPVTERCTYCGGLARKCNN